MREYTVKVIELIKQTPSATTLRMEKPEGFTFQPGQWGLFTVPGREGTVSRSLSFSSSPTEPYLEFTKRISGSDFCQIIENLQGGEEITFKGPMGNLVYEGGLEKVTFLAGGIGITPIRSIMQYLVDKSISGEKYLVYGNHCPEEIAFSNDVQSWQEADPELEVIHVLEKPPEGWTGASGFINSSIIAETVPDLNEQHFFVSGPPPMVRAVTTCLDELGVDPGKVMKEELKGYETMV